MSIVKNKGFTLIEILIVLMIIGITFGFALLSFGDFGERRKVLFSAEQLVNTLRLAQQQAILESSTLGLRIDNASYQILKLYPKGGSLTNQGIFKLNYFPRGTQIILKTKNHPKSGAPSIIITPSGAMTPFILNFSTPKEHHIISLLGKSNGDLTFNSGE